MEIKYESYGGESTTKCPHKKDKYGIVSVGSVICGQCEYCLNINSKTKTVTCNYGEVDNG